MSERLDPNEITAWAREIAYLIKRSKEELTESEFRVFVALILHQLKRELPAPARGRREREMEFARASEAYAAARLGGSRD